MNLTLLKMLQKYLQLVESSILASMKELFKLNIFGLSEITVRYLPRIRNSLVVSSNNLWSLKSILRTIISFFLMMTKYFECLQREMHKVQKVEFLKHLKVKRTYQKLNISYRESWVPYYQQVIIFKPYVLIFAENCL